MSKILIVDDDPFMSQMYSTVFGLEQFQVVTAMDGEEGIQKAKDEQPDIIMLDVMMPKMNGLDALGKMKGDASIKNIPVIMLTNLMDEPEKKRTLETGAEKYIIKSDYNPKQIVEMVRGILAEHNKN